MFCSLFFVLLSVVGSIAAGGNKWDYKSADYGVGKWSTNFPKCNGTRQSPINITNPTRSKIGDIKFNNYENPNVEITATNDGHTYSASFKGFTSSTTPEISGGGLPGTFALAGFHFHWGDTSLLGSEHYVDGVEYPAELHLVHLNKKYNSLDDGRANADGLAVLGVFLQEGEHNDHHNFLNLTEHNVTFKGQNSTFNLSSTLMSLLPSNKTFYRYNGSLTTPGCQEVVTWTVFAHHVEISKEQLDALRNMKYVDFMNRTQPLVNNHRPLQDLNGRRVLINVDEDTPATTPAPTPSPTPSPTPTSTPALSPTSTPDSCPSPPPSGTCGASSISKNCFMFFASFLLALLSFLEF